jgi:hypothetical protein
MKRSGPVINKSSKAVDKNVKEVAAFLQTIGCRIKKKDQLKYEVMCGRENTGLAIAFWQEVVEKKNVNQAMGVMNFPVPCKDSRFFKLNECDRIATVPNVQVDFSDKKLKALFFEFLCRCVFYFRSSKILRKWQCYNCEEVGYEIFLDDGTVATFDEECREFRLLIVDKDRDVEGNVYDAQIEENVLPICAECRENLGYTLENDNGLTVDQVYFTRFLERQSGSISK